MTAVLGSSQQLPSSPSSPLSCSSNHDSHSILTPSPAGDETEVKDESKRESRRESEREEVEQLSVLAFVLTVLRKARCRTEGEEESGGMEIGWPTNVRHVVHVTFDRFHGFLGLPVEFEPEVPRRAPSASDGPPSTPEQSYIFCSRLFDMLGFDIEHLKSLEKVNSKQYGYDTNKLPFFAKVFGVSTESMQCSFDCRGNSVPTILMLMQRSLYEQGGLRAEGIFRINAENSQEEFVRDQLNSGVVPDGIDVHCLAGLIKAWFRELPTGVLDPLSPEQVMQCQSEEECGQLACCLPLTEASLLNWAINLMADVVQEEHENKMNARNVAMVFAPNMTQMADPLTALMYAVQVMNFLKMLILKTLKERQNSVLGDSQTPRSNPHDENGLHSSELQLKFQCENKTDQPFASEDLIPADTSCLPELNSTEDSIVDTPSPCKDTISQDLVEQVKTENFTTEPEAAAEIVAKTHVNTYKMQIGQASNLNGNKSTRKFRRQSTNKSSTLTDMSKGTRIVSRINSKSERVEAWR